MSNTIKKFTSGKWKVYHESDLNEEIYITSETHGAICKMPLFYGQEPTQAGKDEVLANAARIVHCVNNFDRLLNALKDAAKIISTLSDNLESKTPEELKAILESALTSLR